MNLMKSYLREERQKCLSSDRKIRCTGIYMKLEGYLLDPQSLNL